MLIELKAKYISFTNTKDGDVVEIMNEGTNEPQKSKFSDKEEMIPVFEVLHNGNKSTFSLYERYKKPIIEAWGNDTTKWKGNKFTILHINDKMEVRPLIG